MAKDKSDDRAKPAADPGPAPTVPGPRVCDPGARAGGGLRRFKLRLDGHPSGARSQRYVLAPDREAAQAEYLRAEGLAPAEVDDRAVRVVVTELPD